MPHRKSRIRSSIRRSAGVALLVATSALSQTTGEWRRPGEDPSSGARSLAVTSTSQEETPIATLATPYVFIAGDEDGFGYGPGWVPPNSCETFDNREPEDLGVFDQRQPGSTYDSICTFTGGWTHTFTPPPGGAARFTISLRILGGQGSTAYCWASPCGCVPPAQRIFLNGVEYPFFYDPGCGSTTFWSYSWEGPAATAIASAGTMNVFVDWGQNAFAIDFSRVTMSPAVEVSVHDGNGQRGVIGNPVEKQLAVKVSSPDPSYNVAGTNVTFEIVTTPSNASGQGVGPDHHSVGQTYSVAADATGVARATLVLGNKEGDYAIRVKSPLSLTGATADFTATALKPSSVVILKDAPDETDKAPSYAVSATEPTPFFVAGLDAGGAKIGPIRSNWSLSAGGNPKTRGAGSVGPADDAIATTLTPTKVGHLVISANPLISGVSTAKADLFLTGLYVDIDGGFQLDAPEDETMSFVPGALPGGNSVAPTVMSASGQTVDLHVLTGPNSKGSVTFTIPDTVSRWPGIAMNYPLESTDDSADMSFAGGASSITVPFAVTGDTFVPLTVRDYAASGTIEISIKSGKQTYTVESRQLPKDANANRIADAGWIAEAAPIADSALNPGHDEDDNPAMVLQLPPASGGMVGDNLTNFEEYRGFVLNAQHRRTNPFHKNYFVEADDFAHDIRYAYPSLPTGTYLVTSADATTDLVLNTNWHGLPGASASAPHGHTDQKIHRVRRSDLPTATVVGQTFCENLRYVDSPCVPNNGAETVISMYLINKDAQALGITDPNIIAEYRRSTVAHECGHSLNLFHNLSPSCMMYGSGSWSSITTTFCGPLSTTLVDCVACIGANPAGDPALDVTNFHETDTLRIKEDQRP